MKKNVAKAAGATAAGMLTILATAQPASAHSSTRSGETLGCKLTASIRQTGDSKYRISGKVTRNRKANLKLWCFPVHRHSTRWHSHTGDGFNTGLRNGVKELSGAVTVGGTNGDGYKTNCKVERNGDRILRVETGKINLDNSHH